MSGNRSNAASPSALPLTEIALPGFEWLTAKGVVTGLVLYGGADRPVYVPIYDALARSFGT